MNGLIMEVHDSSIIIMTPDGVYKKVKKPNHAVQVGMEYVVEKDKSKLGVMSIFSRRLAIAIVSILFILPGAFGYTYFKPAGYINIDINPSLEITYNVFNRIIDVNALNTDGEIVKGSELNINHAKIIDGIENIINKSQTLGYIKDDGKLKVLITVTDLSDSKVVQHIGEGLMDIVHVKVSVLYADKDEHDKAVKKGVSTAEVVLDKLIESKVDLDEETLNSISKFKSLEKKLEEKQKVKKVKEKPKDNDNNKSDETSGNDDINEESKDEELEESSKDKENNHKDKDKDKDKDLRDIKIQDTSKIKPTNGSKAGDSTNKNKLDDKDTKDSKSDDIKSEDNLKKDKNMSNENLDSDNQSSKSESDKDSNGDISNQTDTDAKGKGIKDDKGNSKAETTIDTKKDEETLTNLENDSKTGDDQTPKEKESKPDRKDTDNESEKREKGNSQEGENKSDKKNK